MTRKEPTQEEIQAHLDEQVQRAMDRRDEAWAAARRALEYARKMDDQVSRAWNEAYNAKPA